MELVGSSGSNSTGMSSPTVGSYDVHAEEEKVVSSPLVLAKVITALHSHPSLSQPHDSTSTIVPSTLIHETSLMIRTASVKAPPMNKRPDMENKILGPRVDIAFSKVCIL